MPNLPRHRTALLALLGCVAALAVAAALAYSHAQYSESTMTLNPQNAGGQFRLNSKVEDRVPTTESTLKVALIPLIAAGILFVYAVFCGASANAPKPQPHLSLTLRLAALEEHRGFLGKMLSAFGALAIVSACWFAWALYVLFRGVQNTGDLSPYRTYTPEGEAVLIPLALLVMILVCFFAVLTSRAQAKKALVNLKKTLPTDHPPPS